MSLLDRWKNFKIHQDEKERKERYEKETLAKLLEYRIVCIDRETEKLYQIPFVLNNPAKYIGSAFKLAEIYGIILHRGMCYATVGANYPKEKWLMEPKYKPVGWADRLTIQEAVCDCLLMAKKDGLL